MAQRLATAIYLRLPKSAAYFPGQFYPKFPKSISNYLLPWDLTAKFENQFTSGFYPRKPKPKMKTQNEIQMLCDQADRLIKQVGLCLHLPNGEKLTVRLETHEARLSAMHAFSRAGIKASFSSIDGQHSNINSSSGSFWGSK